ncbi:MAG: ABC transporter permease [Deltaproteobacteria bacterium]|jgi:peptide/nickel transport system permease protein|nr:ABC transporter permease [Deltaproteobacteria bacterium]MBT6502745.1 ABC transporter permease [Deltaproteobacteria bacterium]MBT7710999.1 ABC transporter permease [Deltaproteobacteria bacterium]
MINYLIRRLLMLVPILIGITMVSFLILQLVPGDPALIILGVEAEAEDLEDLRHKLGLDKDIVTQYVIFFKNTVSGDLGESITTQNDVVAEIWPRFKNTVRLTVASTLLATIVGLLVGCIAAMKQNTATDYIAMVVVLIGISTPSFWSGLLLILLFSVHFEWFPPGGSMGFISLILPMVTLAAPGAAVIARMARSSMLEVFRQDYIRTARAKGQKESKVVFKHALRNALIPTVTVVGLQFGYLMGGAVLVETVFTWPGLGRLLVSAIFNRDYPVVQAGIMFFAVSFVFVNLIVDILYGYLDPRISYE